MGLDAGAKLGPYEILSPLGAGGMGEVYRARDTRLGREVAVKVLPEHLSANEEVRARFEREAKTVSSLNHPNICTLFDVGREGETDYLVMELIEGETLAQRLRRGPLAGPELLRIGVQVADALDRAHRAGVIHRDLKPGNIMLTRSGAKLMDFGLARATGLGGKPGSGTSGSALTQSPTVAQALTAEGTIVGTYQYMAPEQLEGHEADARSDIWAMGCVLYEMASARRAFEGRSQASLIAAILEREPAPIAESPSGAPPTGDLPPAGLDRLIRACLAKDPEERVQTAHAVKQQLQWIAEGAGWSGVASATPASSAAGAPAVAGARARGGRGAALAWGVAALALVAGAGYAAWSWPKLNAPPPAFRFQPGTGDGSLAPNWPRVTPDGRALVFVATDSMRVTRAHLLRFDQVQPVAITGSEGVARVYCSPDGREIAFLLDGKLQRLSTAGGTPLTVCTVPADGDLSWGSKGQILFDGAERDSLRVVPASGGQPRPATRVDRAAGEIGSAWPCFLPDGEHFLFIGSRAGGGGGTIRLGRLGSLESHAIGASDGRVEYAPGGWVLYMSGTTLLARRLDLGARKLVGDPVTVMEHLRIGTSQGHFSPSPSGVFAVAVEGDQSGYEMRIVDRTGRLVRGGLASGTLGNPRFSPDGRRVLYERKGPAGTPWGDVSVLDLERGTNMQLTSSGGRVVRTEWSPDGREIAYMQRAPGEAGRVVVASADGLGVRDSFTVPRGSPFVSQWLADGSRLLVYTEDAEVFELPLTGADRAPRLLADSTLRLAHAQISPDGRFVAGALGSTTSFNVFVQSLTGPPGRWQISSSIGGKPRWTKGGRELVYEGDSRIMAVDIDTRNGFRAGVPRELFGLPARSPARDVFSWGVDAAGERFVVLAPPDGSTGRRNLQVFTRFDALVKRD